MALRAADCAERVLPYFEEEHPEDDRPRKAVEAGRAWARGEIKVGEGRTAAFAARAAGQAVSTAHMAGHARYAANYAVTAATEAAVPNDPAAEESDRQYRRLPEHLRPVALPARGDD